MMAASKSRKRRSDFPSSISIRGPRLLRIPRHLGGGLIREYVEIDAITGKPHRYSLVYINPSIFAGDNGRVLGYDNAHGYPHRHFMGQITREPELSWNRISKKFQKEWREIARQFLEGGW